MTCTIAGLTSELSSEIADQILRQKYYLILIIIKKLRSSNYLISSLYLT